MNLIQQIILAWSIGVMMAGFFLCLIYSWVYRSEEPKYWQVEEFP